FPPVYDAISAFGKAGSTPFYLVGNRTKDGWGRGLVTKDGQVIVPLLYDNIYPMSGGSRFILRQGRHHEMVVFTKKGLAATSI
ncbi:MAG: WG repeat-containing protein, partial [Oxalobacter sp.]|nr:WG repeat-containing protein [Oxalobacter sp.]